MLVISLVLFYGAIGREAKRSAKSKRASFLQIRRLEIAEEENAGRLTKKESAQLLLDVNHEANTSIQRSFVAQANELPLAGWAMLGAATVTIIGSVSLYQWMGYAKDVAFTEDLQKQRLTPEKITDFLQYRSARFDRAEDWYYLASDHMNSNRYQEAVLAYEKALDTLAQNADGRVNLLVEYAQAVFYANDNQSSAKMLQIVETILTADPTQATALDLKGVAEFTQQNYLGAILAWQEAIRYSARSSERLALMSAIDKARQRGNIDSQAVAPIITDQLAVNLEWDDSQVTWQPDDVLLVYALVAGQTMPVAIQRLYPEDFGRIILLTNLDSLMPTMTLAETNQVDVMVKLANINDNDLTKGRVIGKKTAVLPNRNEIYTIKVAL
ncbi:tetratricopeptide repeat protein [Marinomonas sp. A79]|uniref:Tetratricopeptide repeat protein n=1 Tax=Marinomonas vulgaris TaxID=2823372 RepID=A0ABS5HAG2_9GAMM|nr:tetratricopeptide repeat protein [Marinomonas vulgaris]